MLLYCLTQKPLLIEDRVLIAEEGVCPIAWVCVCLAAPVHCASPFSQHHNCVLQQWQQRCYQQEIVCFRFADQVLCMRHAGAATGLLLSTFALVFAAEWGDKSFLATIALSAASSPVGVVTGAVAGHGMATLIAVLGGSVLGKYLNEKVVQYVGGSLFLVFAGATALDIYKTMST